MVAFSMRVRVAWEEPLWAMSSMNHTLFFHPKWCACCVIFTLTTMLPPCTTAAPVGPTFLHFLFETHTHTHPPYVQCDDCTVCLRPTTTIVIIMSRGHAMRCTKREHSTHKDKKQPNYTIRWKSLLENLIDGYTRSNRTTQDDPIFQYFQRVRRFIKQRQSTNKKKPALTHTRTNTLSQTQRAPQREALWTPAG